MRRVTCHPCPTLGRPCPTPSVIALSRCCLRKERAKRAHEILIKPCPTQAVPAPSLFRLQLRPPCPTPGVFAPILFGHQLCHPCPTPGVLALSSVHSVLRARLQACPNAAPSLFGRPLYPPGPTDSRRAPAQRRVFGHRPPMQRAESLWATNIRRA